jgi:serine/threonine protein kinase
MVLEWERGGTLRDYLSVRNQLLKDARAREIALKLAQGIDFLHEQGIMIENLTLDTILMTQRDDQASPRISNLSKARILDPNKKV